MKMFHVKYFDCIIVKFVGVDVLSAPFIFIDK